MRWFWLAILFLAPHAFAQTTTTVHAFPFYQDVHVFGETRFFESSDGLSHQALRSYVTLALPSSQTKLGLTKYGAGAEFHSGTGRTVNYTGTRGSGFIVGRFHKGVTADLELGANQLTPEDEAEQTRMLWSSALYFKPWDSTLITARVSDDFVYYDWLEAGATKSAISGRNYFLSNEWTNESFLSRLGASHLILSDTNYETTSYANILYTFSHHPVQTKLGPGVTYIDFRFSNPVYWSPETWLWYGLLTEFEAPFTKKLAGILKANVGPAEWQSQKTRIFAYGEAKLRWQITKGTQANLIYSRLSNTNSIIDWRRNSIGLSLTSDL